MTNDKEALEWAASWIEGSLTGETDKRVIEFGRNMAMTLRAAAPPIAEVDEATPRPSWKVIQPDAGGAYYVSDGKHVRARCNFKEDAEIIVAAVNACRPSPDTQQDEVAKALAELQQADESKGVRIIVTRYVGGATSYSCQRWHRDADRWIQLSNAATLSEAMQQVREHAK